MYERHIQLFRNIITAAAEDELQLREAAKAAIALMRAAEPKDEAAEREHCLRVVSEHDLYTSPVDKLLRERAAARAEGRYAADLDRASVRTEGWHAGYAVGHSTAVRELEEHTQRPERTQDLEQAMAAQIRELKTELHAVQRELQKWANSASSGALQRAESERDEAKSEVLYLKAESSYLKGEVRRLSDWAKLTETKLKALRRLVEIECNNTSDPDTGEMLAKALEASK